MEGRIGLSSLWEWMIFENAVAWLYYSDIADDDKCGYRLQDPVSGTHTVFV